jgi:predicted lysophospholipase L1 biosynthesis ABC-type transport system permease subunit
VYEDGVTIIGNMDYLSILLGTTAPHDIRLRLEPGTDGESVWEAIPGAARVTTSIERDTQAMIVQERARMERVGIFGTLSIGFIAATVMAILGLLVYSYASLQDHVYRFAVLRAVGLSRGQIVAQVIMEYAFLAVFGALAGALEGHFSTKLGRV